MFESNIIKISIYFINFIINYKLPLLDEKKERWYTFQRTTKIVLLNTLKSSLIVEIVSPESIKLW